jgi:hypothetical protein
MSDRVAVLALWGALLELVGCRRDWPVQLRGEFSVLFSGGALLSDGSALLTGNNAGWLTMCGFTEGKLGEGDGFLVEVSRSGGCVWVNRSRDSSGALEAGSAVAVYQGDQIYWARHEIDDEISRAFVEKLDSGGRPLWTFSAPGESIGFRSQTVGPVGPVACGGFRGTIEVASMKLTSNGGGKENDGLILQFDHAGGLSWLAQLGGPGRDTISAGESLPNGQVLVTGEIASTTPCERPDGAPVRSDAFVARFAQGRQVACSVLRTTAPATVQAGVKARGAAVAVDSSGTIAVAGSHRGPLRIGALELPWSDARAERDAWSDPFVASYDSGSRLRWAAALPVDFGEPVAVAFDRGDIVVAVERPAVVVRFDRSGNVRWSHPFPEKRLALSGLAVSACGTTLVVGDVSTIEPPAGSSGFATLLSRDGQLETRPCRL